MVVTHSREEKTMTGPKPVLEVTKLQELVYELKIEEVMTKTVVSVSPDDTMLAMKEVLRVNRISGAPVLRDGELVGIISIEDVIKALERGEIETTVGQRMTPNVQTLFADETVIHAVNKFGRLGFGRLPVINRFTATGLATSLRILPLTRPV
jgi:predicted transcriptional regulator